MCLAAVAIGVDPRFPLVIAANRDESFDRAAAPLAWWHTADGVGVLGGRDLAAGGTWLGISAAGRVALLTNVREPGRNDPRAPSRGSIAIDWLAAREPTARYVERVVNAGHNGFNLIALDVAQSQAWWVSNRATSAQPLATGVYGLSNAALDTPWPKLLTLKARLTQALAGDLEASTVAHRLWPALSDPMPAPDADLPATGIPVERERQLSPAFIRIAAPGGQVYGTRCSTVLVADTSGRLTVSERRFAVDGRMEGQTDLQIDRWPAPL